MQKTSGAFFFLAGAIITLGILTAEIFYPKGYSISQNMISNLGATPPPHSTSFQPSAGIFDDSLMLAGALILFGSYFLHKVVKKTSLTIALIVLGLGTLGVGIFPAYHKVAHPLSALVAFLGGGIAAVLSSRITKSPFCYFSLALGSIDIAFLFLGLLFAQDIVPTLGAGGTERWVVYPAVVWLTGFGGYLMGTDTSKKVKHSVK